MKKTIICLVAALCCCGAIWAQATTDAQAKAIADKAVAQLQRSPLKIDFSVNYAAGNTDKKNTSNGVCAVSGKKSYLKFGGIETFFDGKTQWIYMPENNEVAIAEPSAEEQREANPLLMVRDYAQTHRVGFDEETADDAYLLCLYPTVAKKVDYFRIKLTIDKKTYRLRRIEFCQRNADHIIITIRSQQLLPKDFRFTFDPAQHPEVEVNDLR